MSILKISEEERERRREKREISARIRDKIINHVKLPVVRQRA